MKSFAGDALRKQVRRGSVLRLGRLAGIDDEGRLLVTINGRIGAPRPACLAAPGSAAEWREAAARRSAVLLARAVGSRSVLLVMGVVRDSVSEKALGPMDGRLALEATDEVTLRCGRASVTLRADGRIVVQGVDVLSRATRTQRIKGGSVQIN